MQSLEVRTVETGTRHTGPDLYDVSRQVVEAILDERGISQNRFALELGVSQQTLSTFLSGSMRDGPRMRFMSELLAGLEMTPLEFFATHPLYKKEPTGAKVDRRERLYRRMRESLSTDESATLIHQACELKRLGLLSPVSSIVSRVLALSNPNTS